MQSKKLDRKVFETSRLLEMYVFILIKYDNFQDF